MGNDNQPLRFNGEPHFSFSNLKKKNLQKKKKKRISVCESATTRCSLRHFRVPISCLLRGQERSRCARAEIESFATGTKKKINGQTCAPHTHPHNVVALFFVACVFKFLVDDK